MIIDARVTPLSFLHTFETGRRKPVKARCQVVYPDGSKVRKTLVIKPQRSSFGIERVARELICAQLARAVQLATPKAYLVELTEENLSEWPESSAGEAGLDVLPGWAFACEFLEGALPVTTQLDVSDQPSAAEALRMFTFDAVVLNRDRSKSIPNCLMHRGVLNAIDHEACLDARDIRSNAEERESVLRERLRYHVFVQYLRHPTVPHPVVASEVEHQSTCLPKDVKELERVLSYLQVDVVALHTARKRFVSVAGDTATLTSAIIYLLRSS